MALKNYLAAAGLIAATSLTTVTLDHHLFENAERNIVVEVPPSKVMLMQHELDSGNFSEGSQSAIAANPLVHSNPGRSRGYDSLDDQVARYTSLFEGLKLPDSSMRWVGIALQKAQEGNRWEDVSVNLKLANDYDCSDTYAHHAPDIEGMVRSVYLNGLKMHGDEKISKWIGLAREKAGIGERWNDIAVNMMIAEDFAGEVGTSIDPAVYDELKLTYRINIALKGPDHAKRWIQLANEAKANGATGATEMTIAQGYLDEVANPLH